MYNRRQARLVKLFRKFNLPGVVLIIPSVALFLAMLFSGVKFSSSYIGVIMADWGGNFAPYTLGGEWWRLLTSAFLHYGPFHFFLNMVALWFVSHRIYIKTTAVNTISIYFISAITSGLFSAYLNTYVVGAGASGAIYGMYSYLLCMELKLAASHEKGSLKKELLEAIIYLGISIGLSAILKLDNYAHVGGILTGIILASPLLLFGKSFKKTPKVSIVVLYSAIVAAGLAVSAFNSHWKVTYFNAVQVFYAAEDLLVQHDGSDFVHDSLAHKAFVSDSIAFDSAISLLTKVGGLPLDFDTDKSNLLEYATLRKDYARYRIKMIDEQSFIYVDSLRITGEKYSAVPPISFGLRMTIPDDNDDQMADLPPLGLIEKKAYFDSLWRPTYPKDASYYRIGLQDSLQKWQGYVEDYFIDGRIQMRGEMKNGRSHGLFFYYSSEGKYEAAGRYEEGFEKGKWEYFNEKGGLQRITLYTGRKRLVDATFGLNHEPYVVSGTGYDSVFYNTGQLYSVVPFENGIAQGTANYYFKDGKIKKREVYERGELASGVSFDNEGNTYFFDRGSFWATPVGGFDSFYQNLYEKIDFAKLPKDLNYPVKLLLSFDVDQANYKYNHIFYDDLPHEFEIEAKRLIEEGAAWNTGNSDGQKPFLTNRVFVTIHFDPERKRDNSNNQ